MCYFLAIAVPANRIDAVRKCQQPLRNHEQGAITADETVSQLADILVHAGMYGESPYWPDCFNALPAGMPHQLLAHLQATTHPRGFGLSTPAQKETSLTTQARLKAELQAWLRRHRESNPR